MECGGPSSITRFAAVAAAAFLVIAFTDSTLLAQVDCSQPGRKFPATPVPECVDSQGVAVSCGTPGHVRLWSDLRPASPIPAHRDSTDRVAGKTVPGRASGHEVFSSLDVVTVGGVSRRLYVSYNAGLQAWNIDPGVNAGYPADPRLITSRDGWSGEFLRWPPVSEVLNYIEDVSAVNVAPTVDVVAVAGKIPAGASFWELDTTTRRLRQLYQDEGINARQVRLARRADGTLYAVVGSDEGVAVYDVSAARSLASPCLDDQGDVCPTVFRGYVTRESRQYIDALHVADGDRILVSASDGPSFRNPPLELWELRDPRRPSSAVRRMSELRNIADSALFRHDGHHYLALISEEAGSNRERLRVLLIDGCVGGANCSLAGGSVRDAVTPVSLDPAPGDGSDYSTTRDLLTYSELGGTPYLYYGVATGGLRGPDAERLFDLGALRPPDPSPLPGFPEVTAAGGSYRDPCNGAKIRYWSHYYSRNAHGLNDMLPRIGKLSSEGYFYRAAATILDVHVLRPGAPGEVRVVSADAGGRTAFESCETVPLAARLAGRGPASWEWRTGGRTLEGCAGSFTGSGDLGRAEADCAVPAARFVTGPIFRDGFESGDTRAWRTTVARTTALLAAVASGITAEVRVWNTADRSGPPEDTERVVFDVVDSGTPRFSGAPRETVDGLSATLTHPAVDTLTWAWEIESPGGPATCEFPGRGRVRCVRETTAAGQRTPDTVSHAWPSPGTYAYRVTLSNCGTAVAARDDRVTLTAPAIEPDVLSFSLRGTQAACCGNVVSGFRCSRGAEIELAVRMREDASYGFAFDWQRSSPTTAPRFVTQAPSSRDTARLEWYFKHTFSRAGDVFPVVQARAGGATDDQAFISVPLQIINGSCP